MVKSTFPLRAARAAKQALGPRVERISHPGGKSRDSIRLHFADGQTAIATRRHDRARADLEVEVLMRLRAAGAPVPRVIAYDHDILLQQDVGSRRLSQAIFEAEPGDRRAILERALESLAMLHRAGADSGIAPQLPVLGEKPEWLLEVAETPLRLARYLDLPEPALPLSKIVDAIKIHAPSFVKWDARLGNAAIGPDGSTYWFDFEHCGVRNALDDIAWLLGDEFLPDLPKVEDALLTDILRNFAHPHSTQSASRYLSDFCTLHISMRLALILSRQSEKGWTDAKDSMERDKIGASRHLAVTTALRGARWAARSPHLRAAIGTFEAIADAVERIN